MTRGLWIAFALLAGCYEHGSGGALPDGGGGTGRVCGGFAGTRCGPNEFCDFGRNTCGTSDESGVCRARPQGCPDLFSPVCGCDGAMHSNECDANGAGVDVNAGGGCPLPVGDFACGFRSCHELTDYCQRGVSDIGGEPDTFTCKILPASCGTSPSCSCVQGEPCGSFCTANGLGVTLTCPGG